MVKFKKYVKQYYLPDEECMDWAEKDSLEKPPIWCSVDLRDGNQALIIPMDLDTKIEYFKLLCDIGFKEIEVGFPAASETEYVFLRRLIEEDLIPQDVTVQVLTQAREHIIRRTFEALEGCKNDAIVHVYNSTSFAQRQQVFKKSKEEVKQIAVEGAKLLKELTEQAGAKYRFQYSPESFTGTEVERLHSRMLHGVFQGFDMPFGKRRFFRFDSCILEQDKGQAICRSKIYSHAGRQMQ